MTSRLRNAFDFVRAIPFLIVWTLAMFVMILSMAALMGAGACLRRFELTRFP